MSYSFFLTIALKVKSVNILEDVNHKVHHTDEYETEALIIRRGGEFQLDITYEEGGYSDQFYIELRHGKNATKRNGTLVELLSAKMGAETEKVG